MAQWEINSYENASPRCTLRPLNTYKSHGKMEGKKQETFDIFIGSRWDISINPPPAYIKSSEYFE